MPLVRILHESPHGRRLGIRVLPQLARDRHASGELRVVDMLASSLALRHDIFLCRRSKGSQFEDEDNNQCKKRMLANGYRIQRKSQSRSTRLTGSEQPFSYHG